MKNNLFNFLLQISEITFKIQLNITHIKEQYLRKCSLYTDSLRSESLWWAIFSANVQTGLRAHPDSYAMGTASFFLSVHWQGGVALNIYSSYSVEVIERVELYLYHLSALHDVFYDEINLCFRF
jgi:hypothetical protein